MKNYSYRLNSNYYVEFETLNEKLSEMSHGAHQWLVVPVPGIFLAPGKEPRSCALVGYSNPDGTSLPNHLCYLFPAVALAGHSENEPKLLVQLEPGWMPALSRGLYWHEENVKIDPMDDFFKVWIPLKRCLGLLDGADADGEDIEHDSGCEQDVEMDYSAACREALSAHLIWLSQCTDVIQNAVSEDTDPMEFFDYLSKIFRRKRQTE
jgi:hypothetical protein